MNVPNIQRVTDIECARFRLSKFVERKALEVTRLTGVNYAESVDAPSTFEEVKAEWANALRTGLPFRVFSGGSDKTIYVDPCYNWAFRFWHDYLHVKYNKSMAYDSEVFIGHMHVTHVASEFGIGSLEARLMFADTIGQCLYYETHGGFVEDQLEFALHAVRNIKEGLHILPPIGQVSISYPLTDYERTLLAA